jgi:hypothetical protein
VPPGAAGLLLAGAVALLARWLGDTEYFQWARYAEALACGLAAALLWGGVWAFANRLFGRHARLGRHLFVVGCGAAAVAGYALLGSTLAYAFSAEGFTHYASPVAALLLAAVVYFHLCTIRPQNRVRYRWICAGQQRAAYGAPVRRVVHVGAAAACGAAESRPRRGRIHARRGSDEGPARPQPGAQAGR